MLVVSWCQENQGARHWSLNEQETMGTNKRRGQKTACQCHPIGVPAARKTEPPVSRKRRINYSQVSFMIICLPRKRIDSDLTIELASS